MYVGMCIREQYSADSEWPYALFMYILLKPKYPSVDEWIKKIWFIYAIEYYLAMRRNEILPFATMQMELEGIMLSEISQSEEGRYHMFSLVSVT